MNAGPIHHVAIVVRSIAEALPRYRSLFGLEPQAEPFVFASQGVRLCFVPTGPPPAARIELVEPIDDDSGVARFLAARGEGLHHVCLLTDDLPRALDDLAAHEAELIDREPRAGAHGDVAFVHPRSLNGVLWELLESMGTAERLPERPGLAGFRLAATGNDGLDWRRLDETWALAGELDVFDAGWLSDHLSDASQERGGSAFESFTTAAALARRVPGKWVGIAVVANTFRHPAVTAKAATVLDNVTAGRFILGMGAGWHVGEHESYGIALPPLPERYDRFESALRVLEALFSPAAAETDGVTLEDPIFPLHQASNLPAPVRPGGPLIWLGGQRRRGMALAARYASGWPLPGNRPGDLAYFSEKRAALLAALEAAGRDPTTFSFAAQVACGSSPHERATARETALALVRAGATHVILGIPAASAPETLRAVATEVAEPLLDAAAP